MSGPRNAMIIPRCPCPVHRPFGGRAQARAAAASLKEELLGALTEVLSTTSTHPLDTLRGALERAAAAGLVLPSADVLTMVTEEVEARIDAEAARAEERADSEGLDCLRGRC